MNVKRIATKSTLAAAVGLAVIGSLYATTATAAISNTKHNLGSNTTNNSNFISNGASNSEICVFCHTPHGSDTSAPVPLWNKNLVSSSYTTYDQLGTSSLDGEVASVGSVSIACLSCHDGTQAMDNILNAPLSGNYDATGGGVNGKVWGTWTNGSYVTSEGRFQAAASADGTAVGVNGRIPNIGTDLRNDHPVGIQYCGGGTNGGAHDSATCTDKDFNDATIIGSGATARWYVDANNSSSLDKNDMVLFTRDDFTTSGSYPSVECASCHDPHSEQTTFLRISNSGSAVCLTCHDK